jgi:sensor histidine kinase YesM
MCSIFRKIITYFSSLEEHNNLIISLIAGTGVAIWLTIIEFINYLFGEPQSIARYILTLLALFFTLIFLNARYHHINTSKYKLNVDIKATLRKKGEGSFYLVGMILLLLFVILAIIYFVWKSRIIG